MLATPMISEAAESPVFRDGLGERSVAVEPSGELVQILCLPDAAMALPEFEFALRERVARWSSLRHASYVRVCRVDRLKRPAMRLALVSEYLLGPRLSDLLLAAHQRDVVIDVAVAVSLTRQLLAAAALLHEQAPDVANGLIAPERLIVTPQGRVAIAEQALCTAIEQMRIRPEQLWRRFRIATNPATYTRQFDYRTDLLNIGLVTLSLLLGRPLADEDFPERIPLLLDTAREHSPLGHDRPLSLRFRDWLTRALQLDPDRIFVSPADAWIAFEQVASTDSLYVSTAIAIDVLLHTCGAPTRPAATDSAAAGPAPSRLVLQHRAHVVPTKSASTQTTPPPSRVKPAVPSVLTDPEIRTTMLPADHVVSAGAPVAAALDAIDWGEIAGRPAAVATARDMTQLFADADLPLPSHQTVATDPVGPLVRAQEVSIPTVDGEEQPADASPAERSNRGGVFQPNWAGPASSAPRRSRWPRMAIASSVVAVLAASVGMVRFPRSTIVRASEMGILRVESNPTGLPVLVDGLEQGRTPARLSVSAGTHILEVRSRAVPRVMPISVASGIENAQYIEFPNLAQTGQLRVDSDPAGATVVVDGVSRGTTPLTVADLTPGPREIVLQTAAGSVRHTVNIQAGATSSLNAPAPAPSGSETPMSGWIAATAAFPVDIRVGGKVLGGAGERIRMTAGRHQIELVNEGRGFRSVRTVEVVPGKVTSVGIDTPPPGMVNLNASPWAELWIDGRRVGETPLANLSVSAGEHEVVFRHPQLGEKRQVLRVNPGARLGLTVEMK
jgi:PEGA domain-containing protein